jgi:hypothetical protein
LLLAKIKIHIFKSFNLFGLLKVLFLQVLDLGHTLIHLQFEFIYFLHVL